MSRLSSLGQMNTTNTEYFLGDAAKLRSMRSVPETQSPEGIGGGDTTIRQMTDSTGTITLEKSYTPFGEVLASSGTGESVYGFTGEVTDPSGLVYLRARYYLPGNGRFITRDSWEGD